MAFNLKDPTKIMVGTGRLLVNGVDVGLLKNEVTFNYEPTWQKITGGSPEQTVKEVLSGEEASITANMLEVNLSTIAMVNQLFTESVVTAGTETVTKEYLSGGLRAGFWSASENRKWTEGDAVTVQLASKLRSPATAGATVIYVEDASLFEAGDSVTLKDGATTEDATIAALGVDTSANSLTLTAGITNSYSINGVAHNGTESLVEGTDYFLNRIDGQITRVFTSTAIGEGDTVSVSYKYTVVTGKRLSFGGKTTVPSYPVEFISDEKDDGTVLRIKFYRAQFNGAFNLPFNPTDATQVPISIIALPDASRVAGDQLGEWVEEAA